MLHKAESVTQWSFSQPYQANINTLICLQLWDRNKRKQAGAELGQAQLKLGLYWAKLRSNWIGTFFYFNQDLLHKID